MPPEPDPLLDDWMVGCLIVAVVVITILGLLWRLLVL
jgi:hypothetical protein